MERTRLLMVFVLVFGTAFGLAGSAQAEVILTFSDLDEEGEVEVAEEYQPPELDGTGITTTFTDWWQFNDDITGEGLRDHTETWDPEASSVYIYVYTEGGSLGFSQPVEAPSIWIFQDSWASTVVAGHLGGQEVWIDDPSAYPEDWVEITAGAGHMIDEIVATGGWSRIDDITLAIGNPYNASNPRPAHNTINVDPVLALLEWDAPTEVVGPLYDVWFGTYGENDPNFTVANTQLEDNTANTSTDPTPVGDLDLDTQYYWRVDVNDPNGGYPVLRKGVIWTFRSWPWEPIILTQPENTMAPPGETAQFTVVSGGNVGGGHTYKWYHYVNPGDANQVLSDGARFSGTTTDTLTVIDCQYNDDPLLNDEGLYLCQVKNTPSGGPTDTTNSRAAGLMILRLMARYDCDGNVIDGASQYDGIKVGGGGYGSGIEPWGALHLTGSGNYVYVPYILAEAVGKFEDFSIAAWVKPDPGEDEAVIWAGYDDTVEETAGGLSGGDVFSIERQADGTVFVRVENNAPETISVAGAIPEDQWTHVVFVYDSNDDIGTGTVYINSEQAEQVEYDVGNAQQMGSFSLGAYRPDGGSPRWCLDGWLDDVRFYAYPITAVNVASLYNEITSDPICTGNPEADLNDSCTVELVDYAKMLSNYLGCNIVPTCLP